MRIFIVMPVTTAIQTADFLSGGSAPLDELLLYAEVCVGRTLINDEHSRTLKQVILVNCSR